MSRKRPSQRSTNGDASSNRGGPRLGAGRPKAEVKLDSTPVVAVKGRPEWAAWVGRLAQHARLTKAALVEHALLAYAERTGFEEDPPLRA
jgi:hypothetical protein